VIFGGFTEGFVTADLNDAMAPRVPTKKSERAEKSGVFARPPQYG